MIASQLRISLTGRVALVADGRRFEDGQFAGRQGRLVFAYLVSEHGRPVPKEELADVLWSDKLPATWEKALSVIVSKLRFLLEQAGLAGTALTSAFGCYRLDLPAGTWLDTAAAAQAVSKAEAALAAGEPEQAGAEAAQAAALTRLPFLAGQDGDWVEAKRRELRGMLVRALTVLVDSRLELGDGTGAVAAAEELIALEPFRESAYRQLMQAHVANGNRAEALRVHERCRRLLAEELGAYPSPQTDSIYRQLLDTTTTRDQAEGAGDARVADAAPAARAAGPPTRISRRRLRTIATLAPVAAGTAAVLAVLTIGSSPTNASGSGVAALDPVSGRVASYTSAGTTPSSLAVGEGAVWVLNADDRTLSRIDPETRRVVKTLGTGGTPIDLAIGAGGVWVGNGAATPQSVVGTHFMSGISRIDPDSMTVTRSSTLPRTRGAHLSGDYRVLGVSQLAVGAGAVWAINPDLTISRIDAATGRLVETIPARATTSIAAGRDVWFVGDGPRVTRIDPRTNKVGQTIEIAASGLAGVTLGAGSVWASDPNDGLVWRIQPGPRPLTQTIRVGFGATNISFGNGALWVTNFIDGTVSRIDPRTNSVTRTTRVAGTPEGVAHGAGVVWVSVGSGSGTSNGTLSASACTPIESGNARPDVLIASDLPLQGPASGAPNTMADAIRFVLNRHGYRAGRFGVGYQSCDDSTTSGGRSDLFKCSSNAKAYAQVDQLVGVIGTYNSACAEVEIRIANRSAGGPLAMISPANTMPSLTRQIPATSSGEPWRLYPTGVRNFVRVVAPDDVQGAADAVLAHRLGLRRIFVLTDAEAYGVILRSGFTRAAGRLGLQLAGSATWDPRGGRYDTLAEKVARSGAEGVFLAGLLFYNGDKVIEALRARLGKEVVLIGGDGFLPIPDLLQAAPSARGMYVSSAGATTHQLPAAGRLFLNEFAAGEPGGTIASGTYVLEAAQAAELLLAAIARSDGTRASVLLELRKSRVTDGILGSFGFDRNGDMTSAPVTVYRVTGHTLRSSDLVADFRGATPDRTVRVPVALAR